MMYLGVAVYLVLSVGGLALFKAGATGASSWTQVLHSLKAVLGIVCYIVNFPLYLYLVTKYELGYMHLILRGLPCVLVFGISVWLFQEHMACTKAPYGQCLADLHGRKVGIVPGIPAKAAREKFYRYQ